MNGTAKKIFMATLLMGCMGLGTSAMAQNWRDIHNDRRDLYWDRR